jgi:hypothetical protein
VLYDMLHSPDFVVDDVDRCVRDLVTKLGLPEPKASWYQKFPRHGYYAVFARVAPSRTSAPSRLEVVSHLAAPEGIDPRVYVSKVSSLQGNRPVKTHATVLTSSDFEGVVGQLQSAGVRYRIDPPSLDLPHARLWVGASEDNPSEYSPQFTGKSLRLAGGVCIGRPSEWLQTSRNGGKHPARSQTRTY